MGDSLQTILLGEVLALLDETFENHHGMYTDKGSSILLTLESIDYQKASRICNGLNESIAGHVYHVQFYINVCIEYITKKRQGKTDWSESWIVTNVTENGWNELKISLKNTYNVLLQFIYGINDWSTEDYLGGVLAILSHCAYHLGAMRQLLAISE